MAAGLCCLVSLYVTIGLRIYIRLAGLLSFRLLRHGRELYYRCYSEGMLNKIRIEYKSCFIVAFGCLKIAFRRANASFGDPAIWSDIVYAAISRAVYSMEPKGVVMIWNSGSRHQVASIKDILSDHSECIIEAFVALHLLSNISVHQMSADTDA